MHGEDLRPALTESQALNVKLQSENDELNKHLQATKIELASVRRQFSESDAKLRSLQQIVNTKKTKDVAVCCRSHTHCCLSLTILFPVFQMDKHIADIIDKVLELSMSCFHIC